MLRIPGSVRVNATESHGGSMFRKRRTRELVCEKRGPAGCVKDSRIIKFRLDAKAHLPTDAAEAVRFILRNWPGLLKEFRGEQIGTLRIRARQRQQGTEKWRCFSTDAYRRAQSELELPLLAHMLREVGMGGGAGTGTTIHERVSDGLSLSEPRAHPTKVCPDAELTPQQLPGNSEWRIKARRASVTDPHEGTL